jgi:glycosyltransferase involved in cell wall biosynthesis
MLKKKSILYIVHNYTSFQKDQIEEAAKYFEHVYVIVRYKPITILVNLLPFSVLKKYKEDNCIDSHNIPSNVKIFKSLVLYIPYGSFYKHAGEAHFHSVDSVIKKYKIQFDLIHSHFLWTSGYVGMKLSDKYNVPFVVTGHGYDVYSLPFKSEGWKKTIMQILAKASGIITVSSFDSNYLEKLVEKERINVIPNGFSPSLFYLIDKKEARKDLGINQEKKVCLIIGNLIKIKGHKYLIEAFREIKKDFPETALYIVGEGNLRYSLEKLVTDLNLQEDVFFVGIQPHSEIVKWVNAADLLIISSLQEGGPVVALESLSCGLPVVSTKVGMMPELLSSSDYGLICEVKSSSSLLEGIKKAYAKDWDKEKIIKYAQEYTWENVTKKIINIYKGIID